MTETWGYNNRLQPTSISVGPSGATFGMNLYYCPGPGHVTNCTTNNGNVWTISLTTPNVDQVFAYDKLNRLTSIQEGGSTQAYDYDNRGNRWLTQNTGIPQLPASPFLASSASDYNNQNQLTAQGAQHLDRGNQTSIGAYVFTYDGESRMATSQINSGTTYSYDGDGRRVQKQNALGTMTYVYDASGNLAAEYTTAVGNNPQCATCYLTVDHLGSTRAVTDAYGSVLELHDYLPFGDELFAGVGGRITSQGYPSDGTAEAVSVRFTGQYRDAELVSSAMPSGLDYFGARYFSAAQGRFTSPDPLIASAKLEDPQTWNRYVYARNNPLRYTDPLGLYPSPAYNCSDQNSSCLNDEQRRILENSQVKVGDQTLSGEALWNAVGSQKNGEALQNAFVNVTDRLASVSVGDGNALSQVSSLSGFAPDRIFANVSSSLATGLQNSSGFTAVSAGLHGDYNSLSFKDTGVMLGNIQFSFNGGNHTGADIDIDIGNIAAKNPFAKMVGALVHAEEVVQNSVFGTKTNQDTVRNLLINNPKVQTITPSPDPKWNRK